ncbi:Cationic amino acid transporter, C-terminal,Amino acid/polyamine transporter I [Cinara cedri]|uniref:Cationic amino acid transporter, C-terminal,Amino acid/polyamine transporter I n=1 Tax=Cinara cedri TaxID=506608 RepID=A0A5E4MKZ0_9HEMI|nr:Cationic amino acid transporter, C-terminal,Amino acid/polyamine transporter I [Cinara cedri]
MSGSSSSEGIYQKLARKKTYLEETEVKKDKFKRVLNVYDLTALGTGSTLGTGVYVLAGTVAKSVAGPAVVLSFILAATVSSFSGVCYAEFAGRVPKAGSAYIYSYVAVGEFIAFIIGWNLLLEHTIGTAAVAKAMSNYLDSLLGSPQRKFMERNLPIHVDFLGEYPDVASFLFIMTIALVVAWGVRKSSSLNNLFTTLNLLTIFVVIVSGIYFANMSNWFIPKSEIPAGVNGGNGGFLPFGWTGMVAGAARCFYGFIGFDSIASTGEETKNPKKTIPLAIVLTLFFVTLAYSSVASVLTLMWPYYDQDRDAPFPVIYEHLGLPVFKYLVTGGAIFALFTTLIGCLFPIPRILYAMSSDGLLFNFLSKINEVTKTPFIATIICGISAGLLSTIFNLDQLVDMASIGTLQSYMIVCICVLILRYSDNTLVIRDLNKSEVYTISTWLNLSNTKITNTDTQFVSRVLILIFSVTASVFCICVASWESSHETVRWALSIAIAVSIVILLLTMFMLNRLPQAVESLPFKVPLVPFVPCVSIILNLYLMMELSVKTWIRFGVWLVVGLLIYAFYGLHHSLEGIKNNNEKNEENKQNISEVIVTRF